MKEKDPLNTHQRVRKDQLEILRKLAKKDERSIAYEIRQALSCYFKMRRWEEKG